MHLLHFSSYSLMMPNMFIAAYTIIGQVSDSPYGE